ncbi:hypothetical protein INS49_002410 [Diaporthe citri]|uniref:uncharacterized protein n=1 Tax=Diaporthe citri TaxID=83186 RepID=UPI001C814B59|nr:uncharacterized protein INS49_002410 [Diaporthe citri]KAG6368209.1 hypothetical protein INS49_002410 [Diaporthe citri]
MEDVTVSEPFVDSNQDSHTALITIVSVTSCLLMIIAIIAKIFICQSAGTAVHNFDIVLFVAAFLMVAQTKGNRRCVKLGHLIECEIHRGKYHSRIHQCVSCAEACAREEKAAKKDHGSCSPKDKSKQQQKSRKSGKVKGVHEKTMKQLRREMRDQKRESPGD